MDVFVEHTVRSKWRRVLWKMSSHDKMQFLERLTSVLTAHFMYTSFLRSSVCVAMDKSGPTTSREQPQKQRQQQQHGGGIGMIVLLFFSIIGAAANSVLFKITLNSFSSSKTNYGFFVSQFSTFLYSLQALFVSLILLWRERRSSAAGPERSLSCSSLLTYENQSIYFYMGALDAASATLGAIAGAYCPGGVQTILNQLIIPLTMIAAVLVLGTNFDRHQIWGSSFILFGSIVASSNYLFGSVASVSSASAPSESMSLSASIVLYFFSILPCACSNIYKERIMKEMDMNEVHTSTVVSFWQLWIGFLFLPLLSLKSLGALPLLAPPLSLPVSVCLCLSVIF
jgi:hypothetical protein